MEVAKLSKIGHSHWCLPPRPQAPNFSNFKVRHCVDRESNKIVYLVQKYNAKIEIAQNLISLRQF